MQPYFDPTVPTEVFTRYNVTIFITLLMFWSIGGLFPLIFWPQSYARIKALEHKVFPRDQKYTFNRHLYSGEVFAYLEKFTQFYDHKAIMFELSLKTFQNRSIKVVRLRMPQYDNINYKKGTVMIMGAMKGCIWDSVSFTIDLIHKLCEVCHFKVPYLQEFNWFIIPIFNPDGYDYTLSSRDTNLNHAANTKNRVLINHPANVKNCRGVYLDRNFGFHWGESKPKDYEDFCFEGFAGLYPFSEQETKAMNTFMFTLNKLQEKIDIFFLIHGSEHKDDVTYPWRFTRVAPFHKPIMETLVRTATREVNNLTGSNFYYSQSGRNDFASGVITDWLMGVYHVLYTFSLEPAFLVKNSTEVLDPELYMEKVRVIVISIIRQLRQILHSGSSSYLSTSLFMVSFSISCSYFKYLH